MNRLTASPLTTARGLSMWPGGPVRLISPSTVGAFSTALTGPTDGFITKIGINPSTQKPVLAYSTFFGGSGSDSIHDLALDSLGRVYVVGYTSSR